MKKMIKRSTGILLALLMIVFAAAITYGCVVTAWTVNSTDTYNKLINMGVSCICTDFL